MTERLAHNHKELRIFPAVLLFTVLLCLSSRPAAAQGRFYWTLDDQATVVAIDNYSSRSNAHVADLVTKADRSTKDGGMFLRPSPVKGLFGAWDRIFVNDKYLAWFDVHQHGGTLSGVWTLDPGTGTFKNLRTIQPGVQWAHNELIRGSASPYQQTWHWDTYAPPIEHSIGFEVSPGYVLLANHEIGFTAANGNWHAIYDGVPFAGGVAYATGTRMAGGYPGGVLQVDVSDANDANGIQNYIDSQLGYICMENEIKVIWRFSPALATIAPYNTFYHVWANYSFNYATDPACQQTPFWPAQVWGEPAFHQSSMASIRDDGQSPANPFDIVPLVRGTSCLAGQPAVIRRVSAPQNGAWIRWGEQSSLAGGTPRWTLTHVIDASFGIPINWGHLIFINEIYDGVWGGGGGVYNQGSAYSQYLAQTWYTTTYTLSTQ